MGYGHTVLTESLNESHGFAQDRLRSVRCMFKQRRRVERGTTPGTAPGYIEEKKEVKSEMDKYECSVCGWVYDPELGDPDGGIGPGTPFADIPDDWVCPVCGATRDEFERIG